MTSTHRLWLVGDSSALASRTAASTVSRLRRARPRMLYLSGDHLSLLGNPDPAPQRTRGLGHDRLVARPSSSSCAAARPWKSLRFYTVLARDRAEEALHLVQCPVTRDVAGVLARIAVAEHVSCRSSLCVSDER